jgi:hypothetical protein
MSDKIPNPGIIAIQPVPVTRNITRCYITLNYLEFGVKAIFQVDSMLENGGATYKRDDIVMEGEDYQKWTNDDSYAINFCLGKLGYVRA